MNRKIWTAFLFGHLALSAFGSGRSVIVPPIKFRRNSGYVVASASGMVGHTFYVEISLSNISSIAQTGKAILKPGSSVASGAWTSQSPPVLHGQKVNFFVSSGTAQTSGWLTPNLSAGTDYVTLNTPLESPFSIGPGSTIHFVAGAWFEGHYPLVNGQMDSLTDFDSLLQPIIEIHINEDQGAVLGSGIPSVDTAICGAGSVAGIDVSAVCGSYLKDNYIVVPFVVNGGKAF